MSIQRMKKHSCSTEAYSGGGAQGHVPPLWKAEGGQCPPFRRQKKMKKAPKLMYSFTDMIFAKFSCQITCNLGFLQA